MLKGKAWLPSALALAWSFCTANAGADELVTQPFALSSLTDLQKDAWSYYLVDESSQYGCHYGDDVRLKEQPRETLQALASGEELAPLQVTLRTYLNASESVQTLLRRNMYIASMECNTVYLFEDELIGHPVLPYEEFVSILLTKLEQDRNLGSHINFMRTTKIAAMDARWFWAFFVLNQDHHRLLGFNYEEVSALAHSLPGDRGDVTALNSHYQIYKKAFSQGLYVHDTNDCRGESAEPSAGVVVDKSILWENVSNLYSSENIRHRGNWRPIVTQDAEGYTLAESTPIEQPMNPFFNANRRTTIIPTECN